MPRLGPKERASLPDRAFAYIDAAGNRRLPIHDASHVRNALVRFGQVAFEDEAAREQARMRLLNAAKKFKIVPVGFIAGSVLAGFALGRLAAVLPAQAGASPSPAPTSTGSSIPATGGPARTGTMPAGESGFASWASDPVEGAGL